MKIQLAILFLITGLIGKSYAQENDKSVFSKTDAYLESTIDSIFENDKIEKLIK